MLRKISAILIVLAAGLLIFSSAAFAQGNNNNKPFNPRDIFGIWSRSPSDFIPGARCENCGDRGFGAVVPPMTPEGEKRLMANKPSRGRLLGSADAASRPNEPIGRRRAVVPALSNDLSGTCNPQGFPRIILMSPSPMEMIETKDRVIQVHEWTWVHREIWTDGRKLPDPGDYVPQWYGYSVGHWEGDTFVVDSTGFDDRAWIDFFGYPASDEMRLQERYRRVNADTLELSMTLTDPKLYTQPWVSETKRFKLIPKEASGSAEWKGLVQDICAPLDEVQQFNEKVRDPAAGITHEK